MIAHRILYNEIEPYAAQWLRNLSTAEHIAKGDVDERSIRDLQKDDVDGCTQFHTFAGVGVWSHALRLAGWPDDCPVWTGSCPCQPFSQAGRGQGSSDARHLWPEWFRLIDQCRPPVIFGEQVASPAGLGWFDSVSSDLEGAGYSVGAADLCAASVGAPHIRQRLYFMAITNGERLERVRVHLRELGDSTSERLEGRTREPGNDGQEHQTSERTGGRTRGFWHPADWVPCRDGKARPVEPGSFPLAHGATNRMGRLRAYGNAICAPLAATFVQAAIDAILTCSP